MKKWMKLWISVLLVTVLSAITASAKDAGGAFLQTVEGSNDLSVSIELPGIIENITSLHFSLYVSLEEGAMSQPFFTFSSLFAPERMNTYDANITWDEDGGDYIVDIVLSGKSNQKIFLLDGTMDGNIMVGTLDLPENEQYYAEVGFVAADDAEDSVPKLQYMDAGGAETVSVSLTNAQTVYVGTRAQKESEEPTPVPEETEPVPVVPQGPEEEPLPTTPIPSGPAPGEDPKEEIQPDTDTEEQSTPQSEPQPTPQPEVQPTPQSEPERESKPKLKPAESPKHGLAAPALTVVSVPGTKTIRFSWKRVKNAVGYQIFRYNEASGTYKRCKMTTGTSWTANGSSGKTYRFRMRAYRKVNGKVVYGAYSAEREVTVSAFNKAKKVRFRLSAPEDERHFRITWKKVPGADGYQILRFNAKTKRYKIVRTIRDGDTLEFETGDYKYGLTYKFKMRAFACDESGNRTFGAVSREKSIKIRKPSPEADSQETQESEGQSETQTEDTQTEETQEK